MYDTSNYTSRIKKRVYEKLDMSTDIDDKDLRNVIEECVQEESKVYIIPLRQREIIEESVFNAIRRLDILQEILEEIGRAHV